MTNDECQESKHNDALPTTNPPSKSNESITKPELWSVDQVADWLGSVGLDNVAGQFVGK